jgi:hypothetical protein
MSLELNERAQVALPEEAGLKTPCLAISGILVRKRDADLMEVKCM